MKVNFESKFKDRVFEFEKEVFANEDAIRRETTRMLIEIGVPLNCQGFRFLRESVMLVLGNPMLINFTTKHLYPSVAKLFNVSSMVVERSIRHSCELAFSKTYFSSFNAIFGLSNEACFNYKPTNTEIIALLSEAVRLNHSKLF